MWRQVRVETVWFRGKGTCFPVLSVVFLCGIIKGFNSGKLLYSVGPGANSLGTSRSTSPSD